MDKETTSNFIKSCYDLDNFGWAYRCIIFHKFFIIRERTFFFEVKTKFIYLLIMIHMTIQCLLHSTEIYAYFMVVCSVHSY